MKDRYTDAKNASRAQMMREAEANKMAIIRSVKQGFGEKMVEELTKTNAPSKWKLFWNKVTKVLGL